MKKHVVEPGGIAEYLMTNDNPGEAYQPFRALTCSDMMTVVRRCKLYLVDFVLWCRTEHVFRRQLYWDEPNTFSLTNMDAGGRYLWQWTTKAGRTIDSPETVNKGTGLLRGIRLTLVKATNKQNKWNRLKKLHFIYGATESHGITLWIQEKYPNTNWQPRENLKGSGE